jgi:gliding motility-associated protein GldC
MKISDINFQIQLDNNHIPDKIVWSATDKPKDGNDETNAIAISVWDNKQNNTLRMDLWNKDMTTFDMKKFTVDSIGGLAQTLRNATSDDFMSDKMEALCVELVEHINSEAKSK